MNVPDLRNVDFEGYERRAREMQRQAVNAMIDRSLAWIGALLRGPHALLAVPPTAQGSS